MRDQRNRIGSAGSWQIGQKDIDESKKLEKRENRKTREEALVKQEEERVKQEKKDEAANWENVRNFFSDGDEEEEDESDPSFSSPSVDRSASTSTRNYHDLSHVAREAMRWPGASDRMVASIVTATLIDYGIVTEADQTNVADQFKIRRAKE